MFRSRRGHRGALHQLDAGTYRVKSKDGVLVSAATETGTHQLPPAAMPDAIHRLAASRLKHRSGRYGGTIQSARQRTRYVVEFATS